MLLHHARMALLSLGRLHPALLRLHPALRRLHRGLRRLHPGRPGGLLTHRP
jgi:hypothetical protein